MSRAARRCAALTRRGHGKPTLFEPVNFLSAPEPGYRGRTRPRKDAPEQDKLPRMEGRLDVLEAEEDEPSGGTAAQGRGGRAAEE